MTSNREFIFTWMIEDFKLLPQKNGEGITSPTFSLKHFLNTDWCMEISPRGSGADSLDYVSCFLARLKDNGPQEIEVEFQLSVDCLTQKCIYNFSPLSVGYGFPKFMERKSVEKLPVFVLVCHMRMLPNSDSDINIAESPAQFLVPYSSNPQVIKSKFTEESLLAEDDEKYGEMGCSVVPYSMQSFARTRVSVEKRIFTCAIKDYLYPGSKMRQLIPVAMSTVNLSLVLFVRKKDNRYLLETQICLINQEERDCTLICKIELVGFEKEILSSAEKYHLFKYPSLIDNDQIWNFGHSFNYGETFSDIEWTSRMNEYTTALDAPSDVTKDLHRLFIDKRFCDVTIRTKDESIDVHKTVLCSRSPVFAAMFEIGMKESSTNVIEILDLESDTVHEMLRYMYTGRIKKLNAELAMNLFAAADKYEILPLKDICRDALKDNLSLQNVLTVLLFADSYHDEDLSKCAITFLSYNRKSILESLEWEELKENQASWALAILSELCMKSPS